MYAHQYNISTERNILKYTYDLPTKNNFILARFVLIKPVNLVE